MTLWIKLRRGLLDHLPTMLDAEVKLFIYFTLKADIQGRRAGIVETTMRTIADGCGWSKSKASRILAELENDGYVTVTRSPNQQESSSVLIRKFIQSDAAPPPQSAPTPSHPRDSSVPPTGQQRPTHGTAASHPRDSSVPPTGQHSPQRVENKGPQDPLDTTTRDKREENSPLPPSLDDPGWGEEITADTLFADYPAHPFGLQQARIAFQQQFGIDAGFLADLPAIREACRRAIELCPPERRKYLPGLPKVLAGEWRELEARAEHQRDHQPATTKAATQEEQAELRRQIKALPR